jgi:hypothetical protein
MSPYIRRVLWAAAAAAGIVVLGTSFVGTATAATPWHAVPASHHKHHKHSDDSDDKAADNSHDKSADDSQAVSDSDDEDAEDACHHTAMSPDLPVNLTVQHPCQTGHQDGTVSEEGVPRRMSMPNRTPM